MGMILSIALFQQLAQCSVHGEHSVNIFASILDSLPGGPTILSSRDADAEVMNGA